MKETTYYKGDPADITINNPKDLDWDGMRLLADRILNDIVKNMASAYKEQDVKKRESQMKMYRRMLNDTPWCNILGVTPEYCERKAQNYSKYKKYVKKNRGRHVYKPSDYDRNW